jgi:hypothetical protein
MSVVMDIAPSLNWNRPISPLAIEQRDGIMMDRLREIAETLLHADENSMGQPTPKSVPVFQNAVICQIDNTPKNLRFHGDAILAQYSVFQIMRLLDRCCHSRISSEQIFISCLMKIYYKKKTA